MNQNLNRLLDQIYVYGLDYDAGNHSHEEKMLNITPETGRFLSILVQAKNAKSVLEIGTSNGYSTLWLAHAVSGIGGRVTTLEVAQRKHEMAVENFRKSGLEGYIVPVLQDVRSFLKNCQKETVDLIFLDAERSQYYQYWDEIDRVLKDKGLLIVDNATSPKPEELRPLIDLMNESGRYESQVVQIGKGELLSVKLS